MQEPSLVHYSKWPSLIQWQTGPTRSAGIPAGLASAIPTDGSNVATPASIALVEHPRLRYQSSVNIATNLPAGRPRLKSWAVGILALFTLATAWAAPGAETLTPARLPSPAEQKLLQAVQQGNLPLLKAAIAEGANVNCRGTNGLPPLLELLRTTTAPLDSERRQCMACLLEHGAAVDRMDTDRRTPLIHAARLGDLETIRLLVEAEAYVMARDRFHKSALFYAVEANRRDIVLYLAANGDLVSLTVKERKARR